MRKNPTIWNKWTPHVGVSLHRSGQRHFTRISLFTPTYDKLRAYKSEPTTQARECHVLSIHEAHKIMGVTGRGDLIFDTVSASSRLSTQRREASVLRTLHSVNNIGPTPH